MRFLPALLLSISLLSTLHLLTSAQTTCEPGSFLEPSTNSCVNCSTVLPNCIFCVDGTACLICDSNYVAKNGSCMPVQDMFCDPGSYLELENLTCINCSQPMPNCLDCNNGTHCMGCATGSYLENGTCVPFTNATEPCPTGTYKENVTFQCINCTAALPNCTECENSTRCLKCAEGTLLMQGVCALPSAICAIGTYYNMSINNCSRCADALPNCDACDNATFCTICNNQTVWSNGSCRPSTRRLRQISKPANPLCKVPHCTSCPNLPHVCKDCEPGYHPIFGKCYKCPNLCEECVQVLGQKICTECSYGSYHDWYSCKKCDDAIKYCEHCIGADFCLGCKYGYYKQGDNKCLSCGSSISGCAQCSDAKTCLKCTPPLILNPKTGKCGCTKPNCEVCVPFYNGCIKCKYGYYKTKKEECHPCHPTCLYCLEYGIDKCIKCPQNAKLNKKAGSYKGYCICELGYYFDINQKKCVQ